MYGRPFVVCSLIRDWNALWPHGRKTGQSDNGVDIVPHTLLFHLKINLMKVIRVVFIYEPHDVLDVRVLKTDRTSRFFPFFWFSGSTGLARLCGFFPKKGTLGW